MPGPPTLIIIPAYNEEASIAKVLRELREITPDFDVLVVDDGSKDATARISEEQGVAVARLPFNLGVGSALRTGLRYALINGYERALQFDADGQHDALEIGALLQPLDDGQDMVIGSRFTVGGSPYRVGPVRGGAMRVLRALLRLLSARRFTDPSSGFRAFSQPLIEFFADCYPLDYLSDSVEALLLALYGGFQITEVPTKMKPRLKGVPSNRNFKLVYHFFRLLAVVAFTASMRARRYPNKLKEEA